MSCLPAASVTAFCFVLICSVFYLSRTRKEKKRGNPLKEKRERKNREEYMGLKKSEVKKKKENYGHSDAAEVQKKKDIPQIRAKVGSIYVKK